MGRVKEVVPRVLCGVLTHLLTWEILISEIFCCHVQGLNHLLPVVGVCSRTETSA